ncbi:MAG: DoxX family protein [Deltaproteobacteria bacterium]|nr:MAG: DoxX family protein [Deltaproteobacteria bacterium]
MGLGEGHRERPREHRRLHAALWVAQVLLAAVFGFAGAMKAFSPIEELAKMLPWVSDDLTLLVRFIGVAELAGAAGLLLPAATRILPVLTPVAAVGLGLVMVLAMGFHAIRGEWTMLPVNLVLGAFATFVAWGRLTRAPIPPRSVS